MNLKTEIAGRLGISPSTVVRALGNTGAVKPEIRRSVRQLRGELLKRRALAEPSPYPTQKQIAHMAGVSVQAVSKVLNGYPDIGPRTRKRIAAIIGKTGYRRNLSAVSMQRKRTFSLGLVILREFLDFGEGVVSLALGAMAAEGAKHGYDNIMLYPFSEQPYSRVNYASMLRDGRVDGGLILVSRPLSAEHIRDLEKETMPCIMMNDYLAETKLSYYKVDFEEAVYRAVFALYERGRRNIAFIGDLDKDKESYARYLGYRKAVERLGVACRGVQIPCIPDVAPGEATRIVTTDLIRSRPDTDGLIVFSDTSAVPVYRAVHMAGRTIPGDISVVGIGGFAFSPYLLPSLSTIAIDVSGITAEATKDLIEMIVGGNNRRIQKTVVPDLVIRESV